MRVSHLIELLSKMDPDAVVVVPASDHRYTEVGHASPSEAETDRSGDLWEPATDEDSNVKVVIIQ